MTNQEAIQELAGMYRVIITDSLTSTIDAENKNTAIDMAIAALETQEPRVLTLEEVKRHNNQDGCVWFEQPTYNAVAAFVIQDEECTEVISPYILGKPINHGYWANIAYNVKWRCWKKRPTDEQRKAVAWNGRA